MESIDFNVAHINNIIGNYTVGKVREQCIRRRFERFLLGFGTAERMRDGIAHRYWGSINRKLLCFAFFRLYLLLFSSDFW